ncbi:MAG: OsmC family protein [Solirubrobacterales bacterium]
MGQQDTTATINGIDLEILQKTIDAVDQEPSLGKCRFRATNKWIGGAHNRSRIDDFYAAGEEQNHRQPFTLDADESPMLAGDDQAPNPVEQLLHALVSSMTTTMVAHAATQGIHIEELESQVEGDIDLRGFLGLDADVPKGYTNIRVKFRAKGDPENVAKLRRLAEFSPVYNTLTQGVSVDIEVEPME